MKPEPKKQLSIFEEHSSPQLSLTLEGQEAAWSLKIQKITSLLMNKDLSNQSREEWLKELRYYQEQLRSSVQNN
jgi:hypothetical protein